MALGTVCNLFGNIVSGAPLGNGGYCGNVESRHMLARGRGVCLSVLSFPASPCTLIHETCYFFFVYTVLFVILICIILVRKSLQRERKKSQEDEENQSLKLSGGEMEKADWIVVNM